MSEVRGAPNYRGLPQEWGNLEQVKGELAARHQGVHERMWHSPSFLALHNAQRRKGKGEGERQERNIGAE